MPCCIGLAQGGLTPPACPRELEKLPISVPRAGQLLVKIERSTLYRSNPWSTVHEVARFPWSWAQRLRDRR